jgi:hypothetical protein
MLYYDHGINTSNATLKDDRGKDRFPEYAEICEESIAQAVQEAGLPPEVTWEATVRSVRRVVLNYPEIGLLFDVRAAHPALLGPRSREDYRLWGRAFRCRRCQAYGGAKRQCAGCGDLLCVQCGFLCHEDRPRPDFNGPYYQSGGDDFKDRVYTRMLDSHCPFALCPGCHDDMSLHSERARQDEYFDMEEPGLAPTACDRCPPDILGLCCPWHTDARILECWNCGESVCGDHCHDPPTGREPKVRDGMLQCFGCGVKVSPVMMLCLAWPETLHVVEQVCGRTRCQFTDRTFWWCVNCGSSFCSRCV